MLGVGAGPPSVRAQPADPYAPERDAWTVLTCAHGLGPVGFGALLARFGTGRAIMEVAAGPSGVQQLMDTPSPSTHRHDRAPIGAAVARSIVAAVQSANQTVDRVRELGVRVLTVEE